MASLSTCQSWLPINFICNSNLNIEILYAMPASSFLDSTLGKERIYYRSPLLTHTKLAHRASGQVTKGFGYLHTVNVVQTN